MKGVAPSTLVSVDAIASRSADKAAAFASRHGIARSFASYDALLADPRIEAVYIPLPNDLHAEWSIRAIEAGKHVLCEKPIATGAAQARAMYEAAQSHGLVLVEGYPYMVQPQTLLLRQLLAENAIGRVQTVIAACGFALSRPDGEPLERPGDIRFDPARGGGALLDAGTYAVSLVRLVAGDRPSSVHAVARLSPAGVDLTVAATLDFAGGMLGQISCSMASAAYRHAVIIGESGVIETDYSNHGTQSGTLDLRIKRGRGRDAPFVCKEVPAGNGFRLEAEAFARTIREGAPHWPGISERESLDTAITLEAMNSSIARGRLRSGVER